MKWLCGGKEIVKNVKTIGPATLAACLPCWTNGIADFRRFIDEQRARCLWFLRPDFYPTTAAERDEVLRQIERHGDLAAFKRAAEFRQWLQLHSSATSSGS